MYNTLQQTTTTTTTKMKSLVARRAWNALRLALLWTRKGGLLRLNLNAIRKLRHSKTQRGALVYGDRQFSFDDTPIIHIKMYRPSSMRFNIPCIKPPQVDFEEDKMMCFCEEVDCSSSRRVSFLKNGEEDDDDDDDEGIDLKAEEFIARFYEEMKVQRQRSYQQQRRN